MDDETNDETEETAHNEGELKMKRKQANTRNDEMEGKVDDSQGQEVDLRMEDGGGEGSTNSGDTIKTSSETRIPQPD